MRYSKLDFIKMPVNLALFWNPRQYNFEIFRYLPLGLRNTGSCFNRVCCDFFAGQNRITRSIYLDNGNDLIFTIDLTLPTWSLTGLDECTIEFWTGKVCEKKTLSFPNYFFQPFTDFSFLRTVQIKYVHNLVHSQVNDLIVSVQSNSILL